jgi:tetratricopeptide (TPR) repeat protein
MGFLPPTYIDTRRGLGFTLFYARRYDESILALQDALALNAQDGVSNAFRGLAYYVLGNFERARTSCEAKPESWGNLWCLSVTYDKLGRHADADSILAKYRASRGDADTYQYATIYAQWGNIPKALEWLDKALQL